MTDAVKELLKTIVYTDLADEFMIVKLETRVEDSFEWLELIKDKLDDDNQWQDYVDHVAAVRACITLLEWYSMNMYEEYRIRVNKYSLKLDTGRVSYTNPELCPSCHELLALPSGDGCAAMNRHLP